MTANDRELKEAKLRVDKSSISLVSDLSQTDAANTPLVAGDVSREQAEAAVRTLLAYIGEDVEREGLLDTPARVVRSYDELFAGYEQDPRAYLERTFEDAGGYDDMIFVRDIPFRSHCEHHMVPIMGVAHIAYLPQDRVVGLSKLARVIDTYSKRLQIQEALTSQIVDVIQDVLKPKGVALMLSAEHQCMTMRGVQKPGAQTVTIKFSGLFQSEPRWEQRFLNLVHGGN